jgi:hypothetical protein
MTQILLHRQQKQSALKNFKPSPRAQGTACAIPTQVGTRLVADGTHQDLEPFTDGVEGQLRLGHQSEEIAKGESVSKW